MTYPILVVATTRRLPPQQIAEGSGWFGGSGFSLHNTQSKFQLSQHALPVQLSMRMCVMDFRLILVFRLVSPLLGHSHAAGRRAGPT